MTRPSALQAPCLVNEFAPTSEIVVPIIAADRHDRSLTVAQVLADQWGLPIQLVHVRLPEDPVDEDRLETVAAAHRARYPQTETTATVIAGGSVADALATVIRDTALLVMGSTHADHGGTASTAEAILRSTLRPAILVGPEASFDHVAGPVLVALDGSPTAERALDAALALALSMGARIELVQVVTHATAEHVGRLRAEGQRVSVSGYLRSVADRLSAEGRPVGWEIVHDDDPLNGLLRAARRLGASVIALGTHGDTGLSRRMLGSTSMGLVTTSERPVFVIVTGGRDELEITAST